MRDDRTSQSAALEKCSLETKSPNSAARCFIIDGSSGAQRASIEALAKEHDDTKGNAPHLRSGMP